MLGDISGVREIYIVTGYTDMCKSLDGLCAIIEEQFSMNMCHPVPFIFFAERNVIASRHSFASLME